MAAVRQVYRDLLRQGQVHSNAETVLQQIRSLFRKNAAESTPQNVESLLKEAESKLRFLRMVTPRVKRQDESSLEQDGIKTFVVRNGSLVEGHSDPDSPAPITWGDSVRETYKSKYREHYKQYERGQMPAFASSGHSCGAGCKH
mmetsp:Transcript_25917/g.44600  ORF Transcript_25917/g.44600 Transcript_25917/m.44600 type:complete len:144 (+) Transcript_25917:91-522(+)|eukprot:CAMPEP_0196664836 /NCGR_PEP_ID=MMETSP1086-20130531/58605_1 /TAXON_ID=77921 /ORGANISM="Cyanoptyche  gloeocystis , Strain SAG4.97" /LENGTH=143 /DNA_ID=CAMNT_0042001313 /DNA_START=68 /DNA_END=499 /DNA_ORIENTATION=-